MIKIGILPTTHINENNNPYDDTYSFSNIVIKRIFESNAMPIGILLNDGELNLESLNMCDAFIIPGGKKIEPYYLETINYAIKNNKPLLGICLGMQSIALYSYLEDLLVENNINLSINNIKDMYNNIKEQGIQFLTPIQNHYNEKITRNNYDTNKHTIKIFNKSKLYEIYKQNILDVISLHKYAINKYGKKIIINSMHENTIEGLEYNDNNLFILGVGWHPELEENNNILFKTLVDEAVKRKNEI